MSYDAVSRRRRLAQGIALALVLLGCGPERIVSVSSSNGGRTMFVLVGQELRVSLFTPGPAFYDDPPDVSSNALGYLGLDIVPPFTPAGPTAEFRFKALAQGVAIVRFRRVFREAVVAVVEDTVLVLR